MTISEQAERKHQEDLQRLRGFRLLDDDFMTKCFDGNTECIQLVLRIVLEMPDLTVVDVRTQVFVENLLKRSVRLDVVATDSTGRRINVEIQRSDKGAGRKRARYNSSMMDVNLLQKSEDFSALPETYVVFITEPDVIGETYVIFITENDVFKEGCPLYHIDRMVRETGAPFEDGEHILYVNGQYRGDDPVGVLMHDFFCTNASDMYYDVLAERVRFYKESEEGILIMCRVMEDMRNESLQEGIQIGKQEGIQIGKQEGIQIGKQEGIQIGEQKGLLEAAKRLLDGKTLSLDEIATSLGLTLDEVKKLQAG